jgi:SAM-dependent methyltransferase
LQPYERLAAIYDEWWGVACPDYAAFLPAATRKYGARLDAVLDLACGAGTVTVPLARLARKVVGLDRSEAMLERARARGAGLGNVSFVQGDFRTFQLGEHFDVVVCASDSLNYLQHAGELRRVFERVGRHLRPGGLFVFDVVNERCCYALSGKTRHVEVRGVRCALCFSYDPATRTEEDFALLDAGVERHRRIPIDPEEVYAALRGSGLTVADHFSNAGFGLLDFGGAKDFYVLTSDPGA